MGGLASAGNAAARREGSGGDGLGPAGPDAGGLRVFEWTMSPVPCTAATGRLPDSRYGGDSGHLRPFPPGQPDPFQSDGTGALHPAEASPAGWFRY